MQDSMLTTTLAGALMVMLCSACADAAPDEQRLGSSLGYPVGTAKNWYYDESVRVGSFSHQGEIRGVFNGTVHTLKPADYPMPLQRATTEPAYRWQVDQTPELTVDDFLARQRITGLMIGKDGVARVERFQYERKPTDRF